MLQRTLQSVPFTDRTNLLMNKKENKTVQNSSFLKVNYTPSLNTKTLRKILKPNNLEENKITNPRLCLDHHTPKYIKISSKSQTKTVPKPTYLKSSNNNRNNQTRQQELEPLSHPRLQMLPNHITKM